ncbi:hypothetical protein [Halarchaeum nitratireducens]|uniref:Uncharacterized protein n=1 Tax=Halarchaeum nitratireducens TaxID=489913 RepID=A0A830G7G5_9EURY|nr:MULTISPECIES: hypothetical protein [Halarchaeum]MBP2249986.1 hypothetical protein [Halarchaeum solikamskense]GGN09285.1 hypothetical protein GCM10009021_05980 [Halarchaeum nitratireducens]
MSQHSPDEQSLEEINQSLYEDGLTDGLPVIPPTDERVEEMLRGTDKPRDHVLGDLGNNENAITVEQLASNAVMAGCLPTYMPVLEAGIRALADPDSNSIQFSVSTGSWAYQWIVNGPVREALGIETSSGAFGPSFHANQTIARALGIAYRNTAKIYPGEKDMGVMGNPFKFSFLAGENQDASPWEPYHVTNGYDEGDSTISLSGPNGWVQWFPDENNAENVLRNMIENTPTSMRASSGEDLNATITHFFNPYNAEELEKEDLSKQEVKEYLVENSYRTLDGYEEPRGETGKVPPRQIQQYADADAINLIAVGGPGRVNAIAGTSIGGPVTKKIEFPDNWDDLREEYAIEENWVPTEGFYD